MYFIIIYIMLFKLSYILFGTTQFINKLYGHKKVGFVKYNINNYLNKNYHSTSLFLGKKNNEYYDDVFNPEISIEKINEEKIKKNKEKINTKKSLIFKNSYIPKTENQKLN